MQFPRVHAGLSSACSDKFPSCCFTVQSKSNTGKVQNAFGAKFLDRLSQRQSLGK